jgi:predicted AAA+ superfamily ATPase
MTVNTSDRYISELHQTERGIASLLLYQDVFDDEIGRSFIELLTAIVHSDRSRKNTLDCATAYGKLFRALAARNYNWKYYLIDRILEAENPFTLQVQTSSLESLPAALVAAARHDLQALQKIYHCGQQIPDWMQQVANSGDLVVSWADLYPLEDAIEPSTGILTTLTKSENWANNLADLAAHYHRSGVGIFGQYRAFRWQGQLVGIRHYDPVQINSLIGYPEQKATIIKNTEALLAGYPALNILLYGGKGTGKSSLIKGLLNHYPDRQLRLIEVSKSALTDLPLILDRIAYLPQKFIIFVDDLSFEEDDEAFKALKVVLEGSVTAKPPNVVVYATSNRRHLVREYFADRPRPKDADEIHHWDTVQEKLSFSDRFGIALTFEAPNQDKYLEIVHHLAQSANLAIDADELTFRALQWATRHNGRSGRTARQFIDYAIANMGN